MSLQALTMALSERGFQRALARTASWSARRFRCASAGVRAICPQHDYNAWGLRWLQRSVLEAENIDAVRTVAGLLCEMRGRPEKIVELRKHASQPSREPR